MAYSEAQNRATQKYIKENLEEVRFRVKKGEKLALQTAAKQAKMSMAQYIIQAINEYAGMQLLSPAEGQNANDKGAGHKTPQA